MEFDIYSIGLATYLEEILNGVAMISGTGDIEALAKVGLLIGVFILGFQAVMNNTGIQFQKVLVCAIMYLAMYGPTARAVIEDVYSGEVAVVDNVPMGPLAVGSFVSQIGYKITKTFETAFSVPSMTNYGFADPLDTLMKVRMVANNVMGLQSMSGSGNASLLASWANYLRECTITGTNASPLAMRDLLAAPNAIDAVRFDSDVYSTKIYDGSNPDGVVFSCRDAYTSLRAITGTNEDAILDDVSKAFAKPGALIDGPGVEARLNDALFAVAGAATDARTYTVTAVLLPILQGAPGQRAIEDLQGSAAIMMGQAIQQQNTQWAAEGSMFTKYVRPFMTFFEGFIYAITPLMAFVIVLGGFGIGLVTKYLMILLWMMLWMPVLSIVNLYTISTTKSKVEAILGSSTFVGDGISFQKMMDLTPVIESQIGVAGMLASSVPALCMFLVYGTSLAASGIASRLNGSDTINEKIVSPDVVQPGPGLSMSSQVTHDPTRGARKTGSDELVPSLVSGDQLSKTVQSMSAKAKESQDTFNHALSSGIKDTFGNTISYQDAAALGAAIRSEYGGSKGTSAGKAIAEIDSRTNSMEESNAVLGATSLAASAGAGFKMFGFGAKAEVGANRTTQDTSTIKNGTTNQGSQEARNQLADEFKASFGSGSGFSLDKVFANNKSVSSMFENGDVLSKTASQSVKDTENFQTAEASVRTYGLNTNMNALAVAQSMARNGGLEKLQDVLQHNQDSNGINLLERMNGDFKALNTDMPYNSAFVAAGLKALSDTGNLEQFLATGIAPDRNEAIQAPKAASSDIAGQYEARSASTNGLISGEREDINDNRVATERQAEKKIRREHVADLTNVDYQFETNNMQIKDQQGEKARSYLSEVGKGQLDIAPFREVGPMGELASFFMTSAEGKKEQYAADLQTGLNSGLNQAQSEYFAMASRGDIETKEMSAFEQQMVNQGFDPHEARGVRLQIEEAATGSANPGAQLAQVATANQGLDQQKPLLITQGADSLSLENKIMRLTD